LSDDLISCLEEVEFVAGDSITFLTCRDANSAQSILEALQNNATCDLFLLFITSGKRPWLWFLSLNLLKHFINLSVPQNEEKQQACLPNGLILVENFVNKEEEKVLLDCINWNNVETPDKGIISVAVFVQEKN
jgi:hypothetical protein